MRKSLFGLGMLFGVLSIAAASAGEAVPALSWRFDREDMFQVAPERGGVTGTLYRNGRCKYVKGFSGKALDLGARVGGVWFPELPVDFTRPFTISIKLNLTPEVVTPEGFRKFKDIWGNCGQLGPGIRLSIHNGDIVFSTGTRRQSQSVKIPGGDFRIPVDQWFQVDVVHDGKAVTLYANGKAYASREMQPTRSPSQFNVGSMLGLRNRLPGKVDDLLIYDRALTPQEILGNTLRKQ